jgi:hypothetical protein
MNKREVTLFLIIIIKKIREEGLWMSFFTISRSSIISCLGKRYRTIVSKSDRLSSGFMRSLNTCGRGSFLEFCSDSDKMMNVAAILEENYVKNATLRHVMTRRCRQLYGYD